MSSHHILHCEFVLLALAVAFGCGSDGDLEARTSADLLAKLERAQPGDRVVLTGSTYAGQFHVPAGVTLDGRGATVSGEGAPVFRVAHAKGTKTILLDLTIANRGIGLSTDACAQEPEGMGELVLRDIRFEVPTGAGMFIGGLERLELARVAVIGALDAASALELSANPDALLVPVIGVSVSGGVVDFTDVAVSGFAKFGVVLDSCTGSWARGRISGNAGVGVLAEAAQLDLQGLEIVDGFETSSFSGTTGMVISRGSRVDTSDSSIENMPTGPGILQDGARSTHQALSIRNTDFAGVWVQNVPGVDRALAISDGSQIADTKQSGIYLREVRGVELNGVSITGTRQLPSLNEAGDGIQATRVTGNVHFTDTALNDNARAGLLFDGNEGATIPELTIQGLTIAGSGQYGLIIQNSDQDFRSRFRSLAVIDPALDESDQTFGNGSLRTLSPQATPVIGDDGQLGCAADLPP